MQTPFVFVLLVIALGIFGKLAGAYIKQRERAPRSDEELGGVMEKMERLEDRIRVLERIVTENRFDLKQQIDNL